jgi:uncharacterized membrane protein YraQ (UPF0718 family)
VEQYFLIFTSIVYEALPFIVLGVILAGLLEEFVPQQFITKIIPGNRVLAIGLGGLLGLIFPMCECGIIPVMRRLLRKGLPLSLCVSYMLAGPIINVVVMGSTFMAFNYPRSQDYIYGGPLNVVLLRVGLGFVVAFNVGLLVDWLSRQPDVQLLSPLVLRGLQAKAAEEEEKSRTWQERLNNITATALNDFVDIMAFLILGAILAAAGRAVISAETFQAQDAGQVRSAPSAEGGASPDKTSTPRSPHFLEEHPAVAILIMMGLAILFCLCSEADAFVAANFPAVFPPAAKLAFLVLGPMMDLKLYMMYTRVFRPRLIWTIIVAVAGQVFLATLILHYLVPGYPPSLAK